MTPTDTRIVQLQETFKLLQLLHHHNKNQHRHAPWWKWLSMLKRCVDKLIKELRHPDRANSTVRLSYMKDILIPKCYVPFAQLVQDKQFSPLGLVLLGELAKIKKTLHAPDADDMAASGLTTISAASHRSTVSPGFAELMEDVGESIQREPLDSFHSQKLQTPQPVFREAPVAVDLGPDSIPDADLTAAGQLTRPSKNTVTASSDPSRSSSSAKRRSRKIDSNIIDHLFRGLE